MYLLLPLFRVVSAYSWVQSMQHSSVSSSGCGWILLLESGAIWISSCTNEHELKWRYILDTWTHQAIHQPHLSLSLQQWIGHLGMLAYRILCISWELTESIVNLKPMICMSSPTYVAPTQTCIVMDNLHHEFTPWINQQGDICTVGCHQLAWMEELVGRESERNTEDRP